MIKKELVHGGSLIHHAGTTVPVALRTLEFGINRSGILSALNIAAGRHTINAGVWVRK
jgi:hypothetical protein